MKFWKRDQPKSTDKDAPHQAAAVRKSGQQFKVKVRLYDGHGLGIVRKFNVFVPPRDNPVDDVEKKIRGLFKA